MEIYLVGGAVRDQLLGYPYSERDWVVVGAHPEELTNLGYQGVGKDFPVFLHPETKEEYALARTERKNGKGYTGFECYSSPDVSLEDDLARRDLTINAIARSGSGELVDPYNGQKDILDRRLRHVSPAFVEDPLRVLRVARFLARYYHLGFTIADETLVLMRAISLSGELSHLSRERVWRELDKALGERHPEQFFSALLASEALPALIPELPILSNAQLERLAQSATHNISQAQRFALLAFEWQPEQSRAICQSLKAPNEVSQLAALISEFGEQCCSRNLTAEQQLSLINSLDALRRPERFEAFLACCRLYKESPSQQQLAAALPICQSVDARALAEQGLKGKAIAEALYQQRLQALRLQTLIEKDRK